MAVRTAYTPTAATAITAANHLKFPGGWIGYVEVTANQTGITSAVDLTGLSVAVTVNATRRLRITGHVCSWSSSNANAYAVLTINEGATQLTQGNANNITAGLGSGIDASVVLTPSTGSHTYKLTMATATAGSIIMGASATTPAYILVEDIGPAS